MADLLTICQAISDAADTVAGLRCSPYPPDQVQVPQFFPVPTVDWHTAFQRGHEAWTLVATVLVSEGFSSAAYKNLYAFFSGAGMAGDIKAAIEASTALQDGTAAQGVFVSEARNFTPRAYNDVLYLGADFVIEVIA